jgi:hypothetical protein
MRVGNKAETSGAAGAAQDTKQAKSPMRFSEILKDRKHRTEGPVGDDEPEEQGKRSASKIADDLVPAPIFTAATLPPDNIGGVDSGQAGPPNSDALLGPIVREIAAQAPPAGTSSVEIQFDSRTLEGLHVRIQKSDNGLNVQFSTSSESVSRLLTTNVHSLTQALEQRGYAAPTITVQRPEAAASFSSGDSRHSSRRRGGRGGDGSGDSQGRQKRR